MTNEGLKLVASMFTEEDIEAATMAWYNYSRQKPTYQTHFAQDINPIQLAADKFVMRHIIAAALLNAQKAGRVAVNETKEEGK